jgi:hypothetical protein
MFITDIATDRWRGPMSEMLLYTEHPHLPIHAALFMTFDGTQTVVVSSLNGKDCAGEYSVSLSSESESTARTLEIVLRPTRHSLLSESVTLDDTGKPFTGIRFEVRPEPVAVV